MSIIKHISPAIVAAVFGAAVFAPSAAFADLKVVSQVTVKGQPKAAQAAGVPGDKPVTTTTYYKGDKSRTETDQGAFITDLANDKMYTLDLAKKTFTVTSLQATAKAASDNPFLNNIKVASKTTVTPGTETKALLGKTAKRTDYTSDFAISIEGNETLNAFMPKISIQGQMWNDETLMLPGDPRKLAQATYSRMLPAQIRQGVAEMSDKLGTMKGFPLLSVITVTVTPPKDAPDFVKEQMPKEPIVTTSTVTSISEEALPDSLFVVPSNFKEEKTAPATPAKP